MAGTAFALPSLPVVRVSSTLNGIQVGLYVAAVLALLSVNTGTREAVRSSLRDAFGGR